MLDKQQQAFSEEAYELLAELETSLLELEENPEDQELVGQVFRAMHTIKGSGAMFGFDDISAFTHEIETVYDLVRGEEIAVTKSLVSLSLSASDHIKAMLDAGTGDGAVDNDRTRELVEAFRDLLPARATGTATKSEAAPSVEESASARSSYRIRFRPAQDIFLTGTNPLGLLKELRELGRCQVVAQTEAIPPLEELNPEFCYIYWDIILTTDRGLDEIRDVFIFVEDDCELKIELIDDGAPLEDEAEYKKLGEILVERGDLSQEELAKVIMSRKRIGEMLIEAEAVPAEKIESALAEQQQVREIRKERGSQETAANIRVPAAKLDSLVDLVGELVTIQSRLSQTAIGRDDPELISIAEEVERLTGELRDHILNIRMLPIGTTFSKFKRLVRDLSQELGKKVEMKTSGAETELDKTVIEKLNDPLVHLIRNSLDHGIESPEERQAASKPQVGMVHLAAMHSGDSVVIEITDDGRGLDKEAIRRKAIERGLLGEKDELPEQELYQLLFAPGFSTAQQVTSVSGRGVGMDVVKRAIESLRGTIEIDSEPGQSTSIRVKIPLTLAIIESLLVSIGGDHYVLPLARVEECIELTRDDVAKAHGRNLVHVRGQLVPYIPLRQSFGIEGAEPAIEQVVITSVGNTRIGFVVDHVIGEHQTVIKSLGRLYRDVKGVSGATILGDGTVALILDISQLMQDAVREEVAISGCQTGSGP